MVVAKHPFRIKDCPIKDNLTKDHRIQVSRLTRSLLMGNSIMGNPIQGNLEAHKDNPSRDNLRPMVVRLSLILGNPLEIWDNLISNKDSLESSRDTLPVNPMGI